MSGKEGGRERRWDGRKLGNCVRADKGEDVKRRKDVRFCMWFDRFELCGTLKQMD